MPKARKSHRNPNIPADLISDDLADVVHAQRCFEESASQLVKLSKRYEDTIADLSKARLKLREELLSLPLFKTRKSDTNPEKQNFDARIDQFRKSADILVEQGKNLVSTVWQRGRAHTTLCTCGLLPVVAAGCRGCHG